MAKGDVVNDVQSITTGASLDFQPSAGVEALITEVANEAAIEVRLYDGSIDTAVVETLAAAEDRPPMKLLINNTNRLRITETSAATRAIGYCGVQTK